MLLFPGNFVQEYLINTIIISQNVPVLLQDSVYVPKQNILLQLNVFSIINSLDNVWIISKKKYKLASVINQKGKVLL